jgi:hypothetical protein
MYLTHHTVFKQRLQMPMPHSLHVTPIALAISVTLVGVRVVVLDAGAP